MSYLRNQIPVCLLMLLLLIPGSIPAASVPCFAEEFPSSIFTLEEESPPEEDPWNEGIWASFYGSEGDRNLVGCIDNIIKPGNEYLVALPAKKDGLDILEGRLQMKIDDETGAFRVIEIKLHGEEGPFFEATTEDVGPWYCGPDPYWVDYARPASEDGRDEKGRKTNRAGIDLGYLLAEDMGIDGVSKVDWRFKKVDGEYVVMEKETTFNR